MEDLLNVEDGIHLYLDETHTGDLLAPVRIVPETVSTYISVYPFDCVPSEVLEMASIKLLMHDGTTGAVIRYDRENGEKIRAMVTFDAAKNDFVPHL